MSIRNYYLKVLLSTVLLISFSVETSASMQSTVGLLARRHFDETMSDLKTSVSQSAGISQEDMEDLKTTVSGYLQDVAGILDPLIEAVANRVLMYPIPVPIHLILNWMEVPIPQGVYNGIAYGDGTFVAIGDEHMTSISQGGQEWNSAEPPYQKSHLYSIAYGNGTFVVIGYGYSASTAPSIAYSENGGKLWNGALGGFYSSSTKGFYPLTSIGDSGFILIGKDGRPYTVTKEYGRWSVARELGVKLSSGTAKSIAYADNKYVVTCTDGVTYYSPNLSDWEKQTITAKAGCVFGLDKFVALNDDGNNYYSLNGSTWTSGTSFGGSSWESIVFGEGLFFAVSSAGKVASSTDGLSWKLSTIAPGYKMAAVGANNILVLKRDEKTNTALIGQGASLIDCIAKLVSRQ